MFLPQHVLVYPRHDVDGQEVHRVHEQYEHERRERDRRHDLARARVDVLDLILDEINRQLDERLFARRHARRRFTCNEPQKTECKHAEHDGRQQRVEMHGPEPALVHRLGEKRQVMLDVLSGRFVGGRHRGLLF